MNKKILKNKLKCISFLACLIAQPAIAHSGGTARDSGSFAGAAGESGAIPDWVIRGSYNWIDTNWGDSQQTGAFKSYPDTDADVRISFQEHVFGDAITGAALGFFLPGDPDVTPPLQYELADTALVAPEPETYAILLCELGLLGFSVWRRNTPV
ncbi:MAG: hypothetical protein LZF61_09790 [Nitrosomonas sp.]|nr:MAG: hypothetical protein LZF61_09790 [Nitrosomonas sp.]